MEEEFDEIEELAKHFIQHTDTGLPMYMDSEEFQDVIAYFLDSFDNDYKRYARQALDAALALYPTNPFLRVLNANYFAREADFTSAEAELDYVEYELNVIPELYVAKARLSQWKGLTIDVKPLLTKALAMDSEYVDAHLFLAMELVCESNVADAVSHTLMACEIDEDGSVDEMALSGILDVEHHQQYLLFFEKMTDQMPMKAGWWEALGKVHLYLGHFEMAAEALRFLVALEEDNSDAYSSLADALFGLKQFDEALENYVTAQQKLGPEADLYDKIGNCYLAMHDYESALASFSLHDFGDSVNANKSFSGDDLMIDIVDALVTAGRFDEARAFLKSQMAKFPDSIRLIIAYFNLLSPLKAEDTIRDYCNNVEESKTMNAIDRQCFLAAFAYFCYRNSVADLGIEVCESFYQKELVAENVFYFMAALYARKMMIDRACYYLERALQLYPIGVDVDFLSIDPSLGDIPEIRELLDIYAIPAEQI